MTDDELTDELREIVAVIGEVKQNLWPDNYAGGGTVLRLAEQLERLCRIVEQLA